MSARPTGSNADEWALWLEDHADYGVPYKAVQIAEAIDAAREQLGQQAGATSANSAPVRQQAAAPGVALAVAPPVHHRSDARCIKKAKELLADYNGGQPLNVIGDGWLINLARFIDRHHGGIYHGLDIAPSPVGSGGEDGSPQPQPSREAERNFVLEEAAQALEARLEPDDMDKFEMEMLEEIIDAVRALKHPAGKEGE